MTNLSIGLAALLILALALLLLPLSQKQRATKDKTIQKSVLIIGLFIPLFSIPMYFILGTPQFAEMAAQQSPAPVQTLVDKLQAKLQKKPNDVDGWLLLGRSYEVTKEHDKAIYAFEKALALQPNNLQAILPLA
ncbi:MAG: tetratricopeptide repeat protein, partial [Thiomicrorhabdus sp.]|nr:tetratricopeptide repeat protein [Thiomicrorhabdus sp.]